MDLLKKGVLLAMFLLAIYMGIRTFFLGVYPDFSVYYLGSKELLAGSNPYFPSTTSFSNYVYPPFVLLLFAPFLFLPLATASVVFTFISFLALFLGIYFSLKALKKFTLTSFTVASSLTLYAFPTKFSLGMGQVNLIIFCLLTLCFFYYLKKRDNLSGYFLGLSLAIKLFPFLLLGYCILKKRFRIMMASLGLLFFLYGITLLCIGSSLHDIFLTSVLPGIGTSYQSEYYNQALSGFFARTTLPQGVGIIVKYSLSAIMAGVTFFIVYLRRKKETANGLSFTIILTLGLIINPFSWQHHFVWLILPFVVTFYSIRHRLFDYTLIALSYVLVSLNFAHPQNLPLLLQSHMLFGIILLWLLQARLLMLKK